MDSGVFINLTNHPLKDWKEQQLSEAMNLIRSTNKRLEDFRFPNINPSWEKEDVFKEVCSVIKELEVRYHEEDEVIIHVMGEISFVSQFIGLASFIKPTWKLVVSTTAKTPYTDEKGKKRFKFNFARFRRL